MVTLLILIAVAAMPYSFFAYRRAKDQKQKRVAMWIGGIASAFWLLIILMPARHQPNADINIAQADKTVQQKAKIVPSTERTEKAATPPTIDYEALDVDKKYASLKPLLIEGAEQLIKDPKCPKISYGDVSTEKWPKANPKFFYTCEVDDEPFTAHLTKSEIIANRGAATVSVVPTAIDKATAMTICERYILQSATHPSTVSIHRIMDTGAYTHANGNVRVTMGFSTKNAFNLQLEMHATCLVMPDGKLEGHINEVK